MPPPAARTVGDGLAALAPIVSKDAVLDGRFHGDPYFSGITRCSLLAIPVLVQGVPKAFVILENRLFRDAFTPRHVVTIAAICGQLAVCIENVRMVESLESKVVKRRRRGSASARNGSGMSSRPTSRRASRPRPWPTRSTCR
jgi:GAF domain-containing protein